MIHFKKVRFKNFLATGDSFTEIDLSSNPTTLIVGKNGSGKSTMVDALSFALFNKPNRNVNKPQLVNSVNAKDCLVEVEFDANNSSWLIRRGMRPNIFEIWRDGELQEQNSSTGEQQKAFEQNVLRMNSKTFGQVVVLGSSSFVPFMQLSPGARREIIESLLDIDVFTKMNRLLKDQTSVLKEDMRDCETEIKMLASAIRTQEKYISDLETMNDDLIEEKTIKIAEVKATVAQLRKDAAKIRKRTTAGFAEYEKQERKLDSKRNSLSASVSVLKSQIQEARLRAAMFENDCACPTCFQKVEGENKTLYEAKAAYEIARLEEELKDVNVEVVGNTSAFNQLREVHDTIQADVRKMGLMFNEAGSKEDLLDTLEADVFRLQEKSGDVDSAKQDLASMRLDEKSFHARKNELGEDMRYNTLMLEMLKDTGFKSSVIRQHLPTINASINQYLGILDFFVSFNLDETFSESIRSRYRDEFSYSSFSEGEKAKIDLALLFTWRHIGRKMNSVRTNLIVLDEVGDSSLDSDGVEHLMAILETLEENTNVFVISHRGVNESRFSEKIEFEKRGNFGRRVEE